MKKKNKIPPLINKNRKYHQDVIKLLELTLAIPASVEYIAYRKSLTKP